MKTKKRRKRLRIFSAHIPRDQRFGLGDRLVSGLYDLLEGLVTPRYSSVKLPRLESLAANLDLLQIQRNLFPRITSFSNLLAASRRAQKGKRFRSDVLAFNAQLEANIFQLQQELLAFTYAPGAYRRFHIRDPKPPSSQLRPTVTGWCTMPFAP